MDPRIVKGLCMLLAVGLYASAGYLGDPSIESTARELAALLVGWGGLRRPGDAPCDKPSIADGAP